VEAKSASRGVSGARVKTGLELWLDLGRLGAGRRVVNDRVRLLSREGSEGEIQRVSERETHIISGVNHGGSILKRDVRSSLHPRHATSSSPILDLPPGLTQHGFTGQVHTCPVLRCIV